uniref:Oxidoreductase-like domain-containing protein n=1 Tax=Heterorhabditis bacteriophora TaxID=37862 RepID=A0A1I7XDG9_HETBA
MFRLVLWSCRSCIFRTSRKCSSVPPRSESSQPPQEPPEGACCGQGCVNCVWLEYGNHLIYYYSHLGKEDVFSEIEKKVANPVVKAFVLTELRMKWKNS